ncbi:MAG: UPF0182 family protein [Bryobacterales bacterium]|nr:UPF0182 family protein [Bryobacterales bacterium]
MATYRFPPPAAPREIRRGRAVIIVLLLLLLFGARSVASWVIEFQWWKEMGQVETWLAMLGYNFLPLTVAGLLAFGVLWLAHSRGVKFAGVHLPDYRSYHRIATLALLGLGFLVAAASIDTWTTVRFAGARDIAPAQGAWTDSVFGRPLAFYLFDLPFYGMLRGYVLAVTIAAAVIYWLAARGWQLRYRIDEFRERGELDASMLRLEGGLESRFLRGAAAVFLLALAVRFFLGRYEMVWNEHGFMVGIDYVDERVGLPLQWLVVAAAAAAAALVVMGRWILAASAVVVALLIQFAVPRLVAAIYVRPNEISLERPYIQAHIHATREAFGLEKKVREVDFNARLETQVEPSRHKDLLDNVRLWDWRAFHDTISQIQALRPYYVFNDSDVDRYTLNGNYRQALLSPRELDIRQLPGGAGWINSHFIYTHGYGLVLAEVANITPDGLPVLLIEDAPPQVKTPSLKLTRPELYYGEVVHEPVFVRTAQQEFNYPSGSDNVFSRYEGKGGFPISSFPLRLAAAIRGADYNILLTGYLTGESRMMIRRSVPERLRTLAGFINWDPDPYLVLTNDGRLAWMVDGYTSSNAHPYSRSVSIQGAGSVNYIRNSIKAVVDAYDGTTILYVFEPSDPIVQAYRRLFPRLFRPVSEMPADLRAHARYPETLFRVQAEIYRTFHMLDPQAFYNKEDLWDIARALSSQSGRPEPMTPNYVFAALPGQEKPEFLLILPFTPRNKDNLIGLMVARCDGQALGEVYVLQLSKQELIFGPMQIAARINQDQQIARDLNMWNQQGSQVLRGQILVLPVEDTFLYIQPIYIQATEARMPQLRKVVVAMGNTLIYTDTYDQAIAQLSGKAPPAAEKVSQAAAPAAPAKTEEPAGSSQAEQRLERVRGHLRRYRDLASQGRWSEAGKELEALESELRAR